MCAPLARPRGKKNRVDNTEVWSSNVNELNDWIDVQIKGTSRKQSTYRILVSLYRANKNSFAEILQLCLVRPLHPRHGLDNEFVSIIQWDAAVNNG